MISTFILITAGLASADVGGACGGAKPQMVLSLRGHWSGQKINEGDSILVLIWDDWFVVVARATGVTSHSFHFVSNRWGTGRFRLGNGPARPAIYKIKDGLLYLCVSRSQELPTSFAPGPNVDLYVLEPDK
jgi:hypothetical protein